MSHCYLLLLLSVAVLVVQTILIAEKVTAFGVGVGRTMPRTFLRCAFIGRSTTTPPPSSSQSRRYATTTTTTTTMMRSSQLPNINVHSTRSYDNNLRQRTFSTSLSSSSFLKAASTSADPITVSSTGKRLTSSSSTSSCNDDGGGGDDEVVPLVFLHGMKGSVSSRFVLGCIRIFALSL
jgi:hypothetical protein